MARLDWYIRAGLKPRHFQLLAALDDYRQLGKVAAFMNVSTPAVSKTLAELERGLGVKLFERSSRGVSPTPFGECLIRCAKLVTRGLAEAADELDALTRGITGKVRVGVLPASAISLLPASLIELKRLSPFTPVFAREATMDILLHELRTEAIELVLGTLPVRRNGVDLAEEVLFEDQTTVVVRFGHPLLERDALEWRDVFDYPWVLPPGGSLLRDSLVQWFETSGLGMPVDVVESLSASVIRGYLLGSDAVATLPASTARELARTRVVGILPLPLPPLVRPVGLAWIAGRTLSPSARLFSDCVRAVVARTHSAAMPA